MTAESRSARFGRIFKFPPIETSFVRRALCPLLKSKYMISLKLSSNCRCLQDPPGLPVRNFWSLEEFGGVRPRRPSSTPQKPRLLTVNAARTFVGTSCFRCGPKSALSEQIRESSTNRCLRSRVTPLGIATTADVVFDPQRASPLDTSLAVHFPFHFSVDFWLAVLQGRAFSFLRPSTGPQHVFWMTSPTSEFGCFDTEPPTFFRKAGERERRLFSEVGRVSTQSGLQFTFNVGSCVLLFSSFSMFSMYHEAASEPEAPVLFV